MPAVLVLIGAPLIVAGLLWALLDVERFALYILLAACCYPATLVQPGGAHVAAVDVLLLVALVLWLVNSAVGRAPAAFIKRNRLLFAGMLFAGLQWISLIWSDNASSTIKFGIQASELCVVFPLIFSSLPTSLDRIEQGMRVLLTACAAFGLWLIVAFAQNPHAAVVGTYLPGLQKNAAGSFQSVGVLLAYVFLLRSRTNRAWTISCLVLTLGGLIASGSRGAMLGAVAGLLVVSLLLGRGRLASVAVLMTLGALYLVIIAPGEAAKTSTTGSYSSAQSRIGIWKDAVHAIEAHPYLGSGGGTYFDVPTGQPDPNNTILLTWAEDGIPGLLALGYLFVTFGRAAATARRMSDEQTTFLTAAAVGAVVALFVHFEVDVTWARGASSLAMAMMGLQVAVARCATLGRDRNLNAGLDANEFAYVNASV